VDVYGYMDIFWAHIGQVDVDMEIYMRCACAGVVRIVRTTDSRPHY